ncbi:HAD family hydrolase [Fodinibius sp.]|uniref:HAD family hydrolase n=1 Tax=Fodinibius sp. TaxID=1872440 RepID=UPI003566C947
MNKEQLIQRIRTLTHPLEPVSAGHSTQLQAIRGIRCVAFDFYGTMFISAVGDIGVDEKQQRQSPGWFTEALEDSGFTVAKPDVGHRGIDIFEQTVENHVRRAREEEIEYPEPDIVAVWLDVLNDLKASGDIRGETSRNKAIQFGIEFEFRINDIWPVPNLDTVLKQLKDRGLELGIISNSQYYTPIAFEALLNQPPGDFGFNENLLIWSYRTGRKKPSTDLYSIFTEAAEKEQLKPREVLYVGNDIRKDIAPAKEVGLRTALYVGDQRSIRHQPDDLKKSRYRPDLIVDDLSQVNDCLTA